MLQQLASFLKPFWQRQFDNIRGLLQAGLAVNLGLAAGLWEVWAALPGHEPGEFLQLLLAGKQHCIHDVNNRLRTIGALSVDAIRLNNRTF